MFEIGDATVRRYDKIVLKADTPPPCFDGLGKLLIDEKSVCRGHCCVTVILRGGSGEPPHMPEGRRKECGESFFGQLTQIRGRASKSSASTVPELALGNRCAMASACGFHDLGDPELKIRHRSLMR